MTQGIAYDQARQERRFTEVELATAEVAVQLIRRALAGLGTLEDVPMGEYDQAGYHNFGLTTASGVPISITLNVTP
jgi:hypothetical protein